MVSPSFLSQAYDEREGAASSLRGGLGSSSAASFGGTGMMPTRAASTGVSGGGKMETDGVLSSRNSEVIFQIRGYLKSLNGHPWVSFDEIDSKCQGIALGSNDEVLASLGASESIELDLENHRIRFKSRVHAFDLNSLLDALQKFPDGIPLSEIVDSGGSHMAKIAEEAIVAGLVIALHNRQPSSESSSIFLFPSGHHFLVPLSGTFEITANDPKLSGTHDVRSETRRGDSLVLGAKGVDSIFNDDFVAAKNWCVRVSLECERRPIYHDRNTPESELDRERRHAALFENLARLPVPYSRSSSIDCVMPRSIGEFRNTRVFDGSKVPVDPVPVLMNDSSNLNSSKIPIQVYKQGCTNDVRDVWKLVTKKHAYRAGDSALDQLLLRHDLVSSEWLSMASGSTVRKRVIKKPKKKTGFGRPQKRTNAHLFDMSRAINDTAGKK